MAAVGTVVRHDIELVGRSAELVFKDEQVLRTEADDGSHLAAHLMQLLRDGQCDRAADAAAHDADLLQAFGMRCNAKRADEILNELAFLLMVERLGRRADDLEDDGHGALFAVKIRDGQRDAFPGRVHTENDELARLSLFGHERRFDLHERNGGVEVLLLNDAVHFRPSFL